MWRHTATPGRRRVGRNRNPDGLRIYELGAGFTTGTAKDVQERARS
jgi:hypothetical protein